MSDDPNPLPKIGFAVINEATGEIIRVGKCTPDVLDHQADEGERAIAGNVEVSVVDLSTGEVLRSGRVPAIDSLWQADPGQMVVEGAHNDETHFYDHAIAARASRPVADVEDVVVPADGKTRLIAKVPKGSKVRLDGVDMGVTDGKIEFVATEEGESVIEVIPPFPFQPATIKVTIE